MSATHRQKTDGRWVVVTHERGRRREKSFGRGARAEALAEATADAINRKQEAEDDFLTGGPMPVGQTCRGWLAAYKATLSRSYEKTASSLIENHLAPYFGTQDLRTLDEPVLVAFVEKTLESGKSSSTALNALSLLRRVCEIHVREGLLEKNPARGAQGLVNRVARRYEPEVKQADAWTKDEALALLDLSRTKEPYIYGPLFCALYTGMRRGEILGLEWRDVSDDRIVVRRSLWRGETKAPKSGRAREIELAPALNRYLDELRDELRVARDWRDVGPVFLSPFGERWDPSNFGKAWQRLLKHAVKEKIRPLRFHDARHTFASWALEGGRSIKWVQEMLGHSSAELTLQTYAHVLPREGGSMGFLPDAASTRRNAAPVPINAKAASTN